MRLQPPEPTVSVPLSTLSADFCTLVNDRSTADTAFFLDTNNSAPAANGAGFTFTTSSPSRVPGTLHAESRPDIEAADHIRVIYGHRGILAARAPYFRHLLSGPFNEASRKPDTASGLRTVRLSGVSRTAILRVMAFLYTGRLPEVGIAFSGATPVRNPHEAAELLSVANQYRLDALLAHTEALIKDMLTPANVGSAFVVAEQCNAGQLRHYCLWYARKHERQLAEVASKCARPSQEHVLQPKESGGLEPMADEEGLYQLLNLANAGRITFLSQVCKQHVASVRHRNQAFHGTGEAKERTTIIATAHPRLAVYPPTSRPVEHLVLANDSRPRFMSAPPGPPTTPREREGSVTNTD